MKRKACNYKVQKITLKVNGRARHLKWWLQYCYRCCILVKKNREYDCMKVGHIYVERDGETRAAVLHMYANKLCCQSPAELDITCVLRTKIACIM